MAARRVSVPTPDDLFRSTADGVDQASPASTEAAAAPRSRKRATSAQDTQDAESATERKPSGRVRHDEKMTVYITSDELLELEHARLSLRRDHGLAVDRGRLVREAIAIVLADLDASGDGSALVRRLTEE
jgi:hypothetical protein